MVNLLFSIHGRISRGPFWLVYLVLLPVSLALILFIEASVNNNSILMLMALVLYTWITICITVKRLHDMDATGWLSIPVVLIPIAMILVGSFPGTVGPNQFGPDPSKGSRRARAANDVRLDRDWRVGALGTGLRLRRASWIASIICIVMAPACYQSSRTCHSFRSINSAASRP